jgi:hypothetical protein
MDKRVALITSARHHQHGEKEVGWHSHLACRLSWACRQVSPDKVLTISGERKSEHQEGSAERGSLRIERSFGHFMRRFRLPDNVDVEGEHLVLAGHITY